MKLRAAFLAEDAVQNQDGTFMVWRAGITNFGVTLFPAAVRTVLILRLEADVEDTRQLHKLRLRVVHDGDEGPWQESPIAFKEPSAEDPYSYLNMLVNLHFGVARPGPGRIEIGLDDLGAIPSLAFRVDQVAPPPGFRRPS